jgi:osmotically-inducible protein OsmY
MLATLMLGGCALAMLNGAAGNGAAGSGGARGGNAPSSGASGSVSSSAASRRAADDAISTSVRSKFVGNPALKTLNLRVDTHDGVVTLRGQVATVGQRNAAQADASAVKGVKSVQNLITLR